MENKRGRCRYGARSTVVARVWLCRKFVRRQQPRKVPHFIARRSHTHKSAMTHAGTVILQLEKNPCKAYVRSQRQYCVPSKHRQIFVPCNLDLLTPK